MFVAAHNPFAIDPAAVRAGHVALVGIPVDANSSHRRGASRAPAAIRAQLHLGSANHTSESGVDLGAGILVDIGDIDVANGTGSTDDADRITAAVGAVLDAGAHVVSIGGDHSVTFPVIRAVAARHPHLTIVHIDAHPDLYDDLDGNPLSHASPFARIMEIGLVDELVQIGVRTATAHQREQAERFGVLTVEARRANGFDASTIVGPVYVTVDLDGIDPAHAPGVSHHEPGGLTSRQVFDIIAALPGPVVGADVVELNPDRDVSEMTAMLAAKLVKELSAAIVETHAQRRHSASR